ncbi:MAG TPA: transaldolase [Burkholderiaceae bacterium]|nr:transaldolase [Burkholderiaceae bacterium]
MNATRQLHDLGQSLWLDNITRGLLDDGTLKHYLDDLAVTGLTSNPTIFQKAIQGTTFYDEAIAHKAQAGKAGEDLFFELAIEDLTRAADLFRPVHDATRGMDGWVSLEVSPLLANDTDATIHAATTLHARANRPNLFIKIPGTLAGLKAIEESIFNGVPINVTLLFSCEQYLAAAGAYLRGIERRVQAGLSSDVRSVASLFVSRWDVAVQSKVDAGLHNRLGVAVACETFAAYRALLASPRWKKLEAAGARPQRLLWASTGTKDPSASDTLYIDGLAAAGTINTMPEKTLLAFADHGNPGAPLRDEQPAAIAELAQFRAAGIDLGALATRLQEEGTDAFDQSWHALLDGINAKSAALKSASTHSRT